MQQFVRAAALAGLTLALAACGAEHPQSESSNEAGAAPATAGAASAATKQAAQDAARRAGEEPGTQLHYGAATPLGRGQVRTYVLLNRQGEPVEVGVAMSEAAMEGLPAPIPGEGHEGHVDMHMYDLPMPALNPTPYRFVELDWNPSGHEPAPIYTAPHFDFHFYTVEQSVRASIDPSDPAFQQKAGRFPDAELLPATYFTPQPAQAVPFMGVHWIDANAAELPPRLEPFTATFLFGTWDGRVIFHEPMITREHIMSKPNAIIPLPQPERVPASGYYPQAYRITHNAAAKEYRVALTRLRWRSGL